LPGFFSEKERQMAGAKRFGTKVRIPSTFQLKHQFLLWWLRHQSAKEAAAAALEKKPGRAAPIHVHDAGP